MTRSLEPGTLVARYRIQSLLGAGGMGEVYKAHDESLERAVALKILPPDLVRNDERVRRFMQEAKSRIVAQPSAHRHHPRNRPGGLKARDGTPAERIQYIAMELVDGPRCKTQIHRGKDGSAHARALPGAGGRRTGEGARGGHRPSRSEAREHHGDARRLREGPRLRPGEARPRSCRRRRPDRRRRWRDATGARGRSSERSATCRRNRCRARRSITARTSSRSAAMLYEAATRRRPFQADSDVETLHKILQDEPPPIEEINPNVPGELRRVIRRCMAKSPERRFQSMKDVALELAEIDEFYETLSLSTESGAKRSGVRARNLDCAPDCCR